MADEERVVLLGTVQERQGVDDSSPYVCKAGGSPAWYENPPAEAANLVCAKCGKDLFLVAQVYAPVDSDRTLYIFGCNSAACTDTPSSWRVLRDQHAEVKEEIPEVLFSAVNEITDKVDAMKLAWGSDSDDSDWSEDEEDSGKALEGEEEIDLEALLQQRDDAMKASTVATKPTASKPKEQTKGGEAQQTQKAASTRNAFPAMAIEVIEEPFENYTAERDFAHENELLEQYMKQEEEDKSTGVSDLRSVMASSKKKSGAAAGGGSSKASGGESYEKTPAQQRHFMRFQKRISRCPLQCLRYDYGGQPLWPVVVPQNLKVPPCPGCGEERAFEMQLTPTINYFLKVDEYAAAEAKAAGQADHKAAAFDATVEGKETMQPPKAEVAPGGMDWLSLIVYSCSVSCPQSREEFIYVLPSPTS